MYMDTGILKAAGAVCVLGAVGALAIMAAAFLSGNVLVVLGVAFGYLWFVDQIE